MARRRAAKPKLVATSGTAIVAAICPWKVTEEPAGIYVAADTRTTYLLGGTTSPSYPPTDNTKKIVSLGNFGIGAYSGSQSSGLSALGNLAASLFYKHSKPAWNDTTRKRIRECLVKGPPAAMKKAGPTRAHEFGRFQVVVGFYDDSDVPHLLVYEHPGDVLELVGRGPIIIGSGMEFGDDFQRNVEQAIEENRNSYRAQPDPLSEWGGLLGIGLHETFLKAEVDPFVGGGIHFASVTAKDGYRQNSRFMVYRPRAGEEWVSGQPLNTSKMEWVNLEPTDLTLYPTPQRKGLPQS